MVGCGKVVVAPSPKVQLVGYSLDWSLKVTVSGTLPVAGLALESTVGIVGGEG